MGSVAGINERQRLGQFLIPSSAKNGDAPPTLFAETGTQEGAADRKWIRERWHDTHHHKNVNMLSACQDCPAHYCTYVKH